MKTQYPMIPFPLIVKAQMAIPKRLTRFYIITEGT